MFSFSYSTYFRLFRLTIVFIVFPDDVNINTENHMTKNEKEKLEKKNIEKEKKNYV